MIQSPARKKYFCLLQNAHTIFGAHSASSLVLPGALHHTKAFKEWSQPLAHSLTKIVLSLRTSGAISLLRLYAFMLWTQTTLSLPSLHPDRFCVPPASL